MISIDEAFACYQRSISALPAEELALEDALWRVLSEEVTARTDLPPFPQSAMDGYALCSDDTKDASPERPVRLRLAGEICAAPLVSIPRLGASATIRVLTGGHIPDRADAVLRQEHARIEGGELLVTQPLHAGKDLRPRGEEIPKGAKLAPPGCRITPGHVASLAAAGVHRVAVRPAPRISLLVTGDELVEPGREPMCGQIFDANTPFVTAWLGAHGYSEVRASRVPDEIASTQSALEDAFACSDLVITAGGISVGDRDFVQRASETIGVREVFRGVRQQPGRPLFFGMLEGKPLLGLPGNPGAAFVCVVIHLRTVLDLLEGVSPPGPAFAAGRLGGPLLPSAKSDRWVRCRTEISAGGEIWLSPLSQQASHMVTALVNCTALARLPSGTETAPPGTSIAWTAVAPM